MVSVKNSDAKLNLKSNNKRGAGLRGVREGLLGLADLVDWSS